MKPTPPKNYLLLWIKGKAIQHIANGTVALMKYKQSSLKKEAQYQTGKLIVISESGFKYKLK